MMWKFFYSGPPCGPRTRLFFLLGLTLTTLSASGLTLDEYLQKTKDKNPLFKSYEVGVEAAQDKLDSAGRDLSPLLTLGYVKSTDQSLPSQLGYKRDVSQYSVGLAKKFITGTTLKLTGELQDFNNPGALPSSGFQLYSSGAVGVSLSQSLWKDFFGYGTRKKLERERASAALELTAAELQRRAYLMQMEADYWDFLVSSENLKLKRANLERAEKLQRWTASRVSNGISDRSDLLNTKALASLRRVQLETAEEELRTVEARLRENLGLTSTEATPVLRSPLSLQRALVDDLARKKQVTSFEAELAVKEAKAKQGVAEEVVDSLRPDLSLIGSYATTSYNVDRSEAISEVTKKDYPKSAVGLQFSWAIENSTLSGTRQAAQKEAMAAQLKSERKKQDGANAWRELLRKYEVVKNNVKMLDEVATFQRERAKAEQDKFLKGRSITVYVVNAEADAAEAEINLLRTKAELRKLEASSQLFFSKSETTTE
jgi:outer membrane protein TolC